MRVTHRLYLAALPSVFGVLAVAALAYWGQYARAVPEVILLVATITAVVTMVLSWVNIRYVARRVERLAGHTGTSLANGLNARETDGATPPGSPGDELDTIAGVVGKLNKAVVVANKTRAYEAADHEQRTRAYAQMLSTVSDVASRQLTEVRLPLHILLENRFGELNENQEEMLAAARAAADAADVELTALREIADLDLGVRALRRDRIYPADMLHAILPVLESAAEARGVVLHAEIAPLVPALHGDSAQLQGALLTLLRDGIGAAAADTEVRLSLDEQGGVAEIALNVPRSHAPSIQALLANRVLAASGGEVRSAADGLKIILW